MSKPENTIYVLVFLIILLLILGKLFADAQQPPKVCYYSSDCRGDECAISDSTGQHCVAKQYGVMVWDSPCITKIEKTLKTHIEAPLNEDGTPDMSRAVILEPLTTFNKACGRIEIRKREQ